MPTLIKYTGQQLRWPELATTGKQSIWNPGQQESRADSEAKLLLATGLFNNMSGRTPLYGDRVITADDNEAIFDCMVALTITVSAGLSPKPNFVPIPPPSGNLSIAFTGGATGNGSATTQTFTRVASPAGVAVTAYAEAGDGYGVR